MLGADFFSEKPGFSDSRIPGAWKNVEQSSGQTPFVCGMLQLKTSSVLRAHFPVSLHCT
jgi:hypothetical protein